MLYYSIEIVLQNMLFVIIISQFSVDVLCVILILDKKNKTTTMLTLVALVLGAGPISSKIEKVPRDIQSEKSRKTRQVWV